MIWIWVVEVIGIDRLSQTSIDLIKMKTALRVYAKTTKGSDPYLHQELLSLGMKPKHDELMHSFYFNATFN